MCLNVDRYIVRPNETQLINNTYSDVQIPQLPYEYSHNQVPSPIPYSDVRIRRSHTYFVTLHVYYGYIETE